MTKTHGVLDAMLKCRDRLDFYPCIADAELHVDTLDHTCHKFIVEIVFMIFNTKKLSTYMYGDTAACVYITN